VHSRLFACIRGLIILLLPSLAIAHEVITTKITWSREISRIVYTRCAACHGDSSTVPLMTYQQARPWAKAIKDEVLNRRMPPWGAVKGYSEFQHDPSLSQEQIGTIAQWVEGGAPEGDPKLLPTLPQPVGKTKPLAGVRFPLPSRLDRSIRLLGLEPQADAADVRVFAVLPDGSVEPLVRLFGYHAAWRRTFAYTNPIRLPKGTQIQFDPAPVPLTAVRAR
jgi:hypothetical protein